MEVLSLYFVLYLLLNETEKPRLFKNHVHTYTRPRSSTHSWLMVDEIAV